MDQPASEILTDDCLKCIFEKLPITERVNIERVSHRWRTISQNSWQNLKQLNLDEDLFDCCTEWVEPYSHCKMGLNVIEQVLVRAGKYLKSINFPRYCHTGVLTIKHSSDVLSLIAKHCPNLEELFDIHIDNPESMTLLANNCVKIRLLTVEEIEDDCEEVLALLFRNNPSLSKLHLDGSLLSGDCLLDLPTLALTELHLNFDCDFNMENLKILEKMPNLTSLTITTTIAESSSTAIRENPLVLSMTSKILATISVEGWPIIFETSRLENLTCLILEKNLAIDDDFLRDLADSCKGIQYLNISGCSNVTDNGVRALFRGLTQLKELVLRYMDNISDAEFRGMPQLRYFDCSASVRIGSAGLVGLINGSPNLALTIAWHCASIIDEELRALVAEARNALEDSIDLIILLDSISIHVKESDFSVTRAGDPIEFAEICSTLQLIPCRSLLQTFAV